MAGVIVDNNELLINLLEAAKINAEDRIEEAEHNASFLADVASVSPDVFGPTAKISGGLKLRVVAARAFDEQSRKTYPRITEAGDRTARVDQVIKVLGLEQVDNISEARIGWTTVRFDGIDNGITADFQFGWGQNRLKFEVSGEAQ